MIDSIITLVSVGIGFGLSQLSECIKENRRINKSLEAIEIELLDLENILFERVESSKIAAKNCILGDYSFPLSPTISTPALNKYYVDLLSHYEANQRYNLTALIDLLKSFNKITEWIESKGISECKSIEITNKAINRYRFSLFSYELIKEANKKGGQEKIDEHHLSYIKAKEKIDLLYKS
ncbi:hypothetical protein [Marinomonas sp.]|uniref:hypothetical protein n=1 Tax=Marinomonas sp. TaxID=1904862 RepID=UPI003F976542